MHFFIPTPTRSTLELGPLTIHFYALTILLGIIIAMVVGRSRYRSLGGDPEELTDIAFWTIPAGIIGGRIYHVITSPDAYFGSHGRPIDAFKIWQGGMGIWGAIALGFVVARWRFAKTPRSLTFLQVADALAPGILLAQGVGRWGNWFNGELFGRPTTLPWGLEIPPNLRPAGFAQFATFHPTFLYESLWCFAGAAVLLTLPTMARLAPGYLFVAYIAIYTAGRLWIEALRIDQAHQIFGVRLNIWVSGLVLVVAVTALIRSQQRGLGSETVDSAND